MPAMAFAAARPSGQPHVCFATTHARRLALSVALAVLLMLAACSTVTQKAPSRATLYTAGGAIRASDGEMRWTQALGSAPALLANGVLYATVNAPSVLPEMPEVHAVRASDGATLWTAQPQGCCGPLALANNNLLVPVFQSGHFQPGVGYSGQLALVALRRNDGRVAWRSTPVTAIVIPQIDTPAPFVSQLAVSRGMVVAEAAATPETSYLVAWNLDTGKLAWRTLLADRSDYGAPSFSDTPAGVVVSALYGQASDVATVDLATGKLLWYRTRIGGSFLATNGVDVFSDGLTGVIIGVRPSDGTVLWQANLGPSGQKTYSYCTCEIAADADTLYYRSLPSDCPSPGMKVSCMPRLSAIRLDSGALRWQRTLDAETPEFANNAVVGNNVLYYASFTPPSQSEGYQFFLLAFATRDGHLLWRHTTDGLFERVVATDDAIFAIVSRETGTCGGALESLSTVNGSFQWVRDYPNCAGLVPLSGGWLVVG